MDLGKHYSALSVKDIKASVAFYLKLGFEPLPGAGAIDQKWMILRNGEVMLGLYQDMFPRNVLTFNPPDVRAIHAKLKAAGVDIFKASEMDKPGPAYMMLNDPDGNPILIDQIKQKS